MDRLSFNELADMHIMYGLAQSNAAEARRLYIQSFPNRDVSGIESFRNVDRNLREFGTLKKRTSEGRPRVDVVTEEEVLEQFERNPATSVRTVSDEIGVPNQYGTFYQEIQCIHITCNEFKDFLLQIMVPVCNFANGL